MLASCINIVEYSHIILLNVYKLDCWLHSSIPPSLISPPASPLCTPYISLPRSVDIPLLDKHTLIIQQDDLTDDIYLASGRLPL